MSVSVPSMSPAARNLSLSDASMSMPDLTMSSSDPTTSPWTSDIEGRGPQVYNVNHGRHKYKAGWKNTLTNFLGRKAGSEIAQNDQVGGLCSLTSNLSSSQEEVASGFRASHPARYSIHSVKSPTLAASASLRTSLESSMASSGVPGIGYYSGKALKWLGERSLDAVDGVIILRRTYRHLARLKRWKKQERSEIATQQQQKLFNMLEDALEMSRPCYSSVVNKAAAVIARAVDDWTLNHLTGSNTKEIDAWLTQIHVCLSPMRLARSHAHAAPTDLFWDLLTAVTRVPLHLQDKETTSTVVRLLARELADSPYGTHHRWLAESLRRIVKQTQQTRPLTAEEMAVLRSIATRRLERGDAGQACSRPWEVVLFAECASQSPWCTEIVCGPRGLQSLFTSLDLAVGEPAARDDSDWVNIDDLLASLLSLSRHAWLESSFAATPDLIGVLLRVLRQSTRERRFRSCACIVFTLRNLTSHQFEAMCTPEATIILAALAAVPTRRGTSSEEYYAKIARRYARELLCDLGDSSVTPSGFTSEADL